MLWFFCVYSHARVQAAWFVGARSMGRSCVEIFYSHAWVQVASLVGARTRGRGLCVCRTIGAHMLASGYSLLHCINAHSLASFAFFRSSNSETVIVSAAVCRYLFLPLHWLGHQNCCQKRSWLPWLLLLLCSCSFGLRLLELSLLIVVICEAANLQPKMNRVSLISLLYFCSLLWFSSFYYYEYTLSNTVC